MPNSGENEVEVVWAGVGVVAVSMVVVGVLTGCSGWLQPRRKRVSKRRNRILNLMNPLKF
ncbi:MAG: hypothetical protein H5T46_04530 [Archaeoglobi archaeon]|nr:hypothetical protein [Candidatus Mnemosynella sp.]